MRLQELKSLYDHLNTLREGYAEQELEEILSNRKVGINRTYHRVGRACIFPDPEYFVQQVAKLERIDIPIFAIITPFTLDKNSPGAIYWVVQKPDGRDENWLTRTTYGYGGTGPHQSAVILELFERSKTPIEVRTGDYLLGFLE